MSKVQWLGSRADQTFVVVEALKNQGAWIVQARFLAGRDGPEIGSDRPQWLPGEYDYPDDLALCFEAAIAEMTAIGYRAV